MVSSHNTMRMPQYLSGSKSPCQEDRSDAPKFLSLSFIAFRGVDPLCSANVLKDDTRIRTSMRKFKGNMEFEIGVNGKLTAGMPGTMLKIVFVT